MKWFRNQDNRDMDVVAAVELAPLLARPKTDRDARRAGQMRTRGITTVGEFNGLLFLAALSPKHTSKYLTPSFLSTILNEAADFEATAFSLSLHMDADAAESRKRAMRTGTFAIARALDMPQHPVDIVRQNERATLRRYQSRDRLRLTDLGEAITATEFLHPEREQVAHLAVVVAGNISDEGVLPGRLNAGDIFKHDRTNVAAGVIDWSQIHAR